MSNIKQDLASKINEMIKVVTEMPSGRGKGLILSTLGDLSNMVELTVTTEGSFNSEGRAVKTAFRRSAPTEGNGTANCCNSDELLE